MAMAGPVEAEAARSYRIGLLMTLIGVLVITPDALFVRLIGSDPWTMVFWRGVLVPTAFLIFLWLRFGPAMIRDSLRQAGPVGLGVALCYTGTTIGFMGALHGTTVANTLVILAASPFFAAVLSRVFLGEAIPVQTWAAIAAAFVGIATVVSEGLLKPSATADPGGDLMALFAALMLATSFVLIRSRRHVNMVPATAMGGYLGALVAFPLATPLAIDMDQAMLLGVLCLIILPISFGLIAIAPRRVPAPEVGLLLLLETVLGPVWVWLIIGETPGPFAVVGGSVVIGALAVHSVWRMRRRPPPGAVPI
jgi:drug/metabolite transporter (DMT)-like permease